MGMPTPRIIGALPSETPAELKTTGGRRRRLPDDLLRQASRRLQILTLVAGTLWVVGPVLGHLAIHYTDPQDPRGMAFRVIDGIALFAFATCIALFLYLRGPRRDPGFLLDLGLAYLVLMAVDMGVMTHWATG